MSATVRPLRKRRRRSLVVLIRIYALAIALVFVIVAALAYAFVTAPALRVRSVGVVPSAHVSAHAIRAAAAIDPSANVWLLNTHAIADRVESIPYVKDALISRSLPARISIGVTERTDFACLVTPVERVTIDEFARELHSGCSSALPVLRDATRLVLTPGMFVTDPTVRRMIRDDERLSRTLPVRSLALGMFDSLEVVTTSAIRVQFGPDDAQLEGKADLVAPIAAEARKHGRKVQTVDLRSATTPVVTFVALPSPTPGTGCCRRTGTKPNI